MSWDPFQSCLSDSTPASKVPPPQPQEAWDRDVDFSACFCCPEKWGHPCHPGKTKTPLQCKYLQQPFIWSFRAYILHTTYTISPACHHCPPSVGCHSAFSQQKHCHKFRTSRFGSSVRSVIAFGIICVQDINRGGNLGGFLPFFQTYSRWNSYWGVGWYQPGKTIWLAIAMLPLIKSLFSIFVCFF